MLVAPACLLLGAFPSTFCQFCPWISSKARWDGAWRCQTPVSWSPSSWVFFLLWGWLHLAALTPLSCVFLDSIKSPWVMFYNFKKVGKRKNLLVSHLGLTNFQAIFKSPRMSILTEFLTWFLKVTVTPFSIHGVSKHPKKEQSSQVITLGGLYRSKSPRKGTETAPFIANLQLQEVFKNILPDQSFSCKLVSSKLVFPN